jgi:hypothetical protein
MKKIITIFGLCVVFYRHAAAQTNQDIFGNVQWKSQSKTVQWYRQQYPQLTNLTDERVVTALGNKFPQLIKTDSVFSNEFFTLNPIIQTQSEPANQITTRDNETYQGVSVLKVDPDGLTISYTNSTKAVLLKKLPFEDLSDALQQKYHYDSQASADYRAKQKQGMAELRAQLEANQQIAVAAENVRIDEGLQQRQIEENQKLNEKLAKATQEEADARQKAADAAMIQAMKPPPQINMQQNTIVY